MKKYDLCVKSGAYTDRNGNEKVNWENVGVMMVNSNGPYLLIKPWVNLAGFPREEGRSHLIVSLFEHNETEQRSSRNSEERRFQLRCSELQPCQNPVLAMAKFRVAITRTETQVFIVEAQNSTEAVEKLSDAWDNGTIELDSTDISDADFSLIGRADDKARAVV